MLNQRLESIVVETNAFKTCSDVNQKYSLIWLHGLGADGYDFVPMAKEIERKISLPIRFIFPHAPKRPVTLNNGYVMPAWYDITGLDLESREDREGLENSAKQIDEILQHEIQFGISSERIFLGGFSQGGAQAIYMGLRYPVKLAGLIVFSGYLPFYKTLSDDLQQSVYPNVNTLIFWAQGTEDTVVLPTFGKVSVRALEKAGLSVDFHSYPMAHQVCDEEIKELTEWMIKR